MDVEIHDDKKTWTYENIVRSCQSDGVLYLTFEDGEDKEIDLSDTADVVVEHDLKESVLVNQFESAKEKLS